ncbi:NnrS family protein [Candidatus Parabeggiatoa sp. HSG14]|uniref:NnrS family protein n=1 Tax=Candidatus Parabeggiatoa sp. HSG14 TaxID=3055593 RepID=UPI0025A78C34|nr:NnrS family protein [Thiotrichales bacterium HSG14]
MNLRWTTFSAAPHRMMFFLGMLQLILTIFWWLIDLLGRYTNWWHPPPTIIPSNWVHIFFMLYGLPTFFIFGFLMTTYPRWMNGQFIPYHHYSRAFFLLISAILLIYIGLFTKLFILAAGVLLFLIGWGTVFYTLLQVYFHSPANDKHYESVLNLSLLAGFIGVLSYFLWLVTEQWLFLNFALHGGLWLYLIPVLITVCHRMLPFFSSCVLPNYQVIQPIWSLPIIGICVTGHAVLEMQSWLAWRFIFDMPLMFLVFHHSLRWGLWRSLQIRLLAVLHIAFLWLGIALLLYNWQSLTLLFSNQFILGKAPLHALTIGFMISLIIGMASRVTLGHSGRDLIADTFTWICFWGVSVTALLRIFAEFLWINSLFILDFNVLTAIIWLLFLLPWVIRYMPMVLLPRVDGKPG